MTQTQTQTPMTPVRNLANDLLITAVEGGINYWALIYKYELPGQFTDGFAFIVNNAEDEVAEYNFLGHVLNWDEIGDMIATEEIKLRALSPREIEQTVRKLGNGEFDMPRRWQIRALQWLEDPEDADYDAEDADVIAQLTVFGNVLYA